MKEELIAYIMKEFVEDPDQEIDETTLLISSGLIDSLSIVSLVAFIDKKFGVKIPDEKGTVDNFETINKIIETINEFKK
ncbi:MAG: acyl carrier protein [candidate division Zixibacteria bacterium]|nr:acyl carrier protein [candidate division Zixibacteria bacterium]